MADSSITPIPANLNVAFSVLFSTTNAIINAIATEIVTANNSAAGATTTGNGFVIGIFGATTLITSGLRGGNTSASNTLNVTSNLAINSSSVFTLGNTLANNTTVQANVFIGGFASPFNIGNTFYYDIIATTAGLSTQVVDSFALITYRAAEYFVTVKDLNANNYLMTKLNILHDGGSGYMTEYSTLTTNTINMGAFSVSANSTQVILSFTPISTSTTVKMQRVCLTI